MKLKVILSIFVTLIFFACKQSLRPIVNEEGLSGPVKEKYDTVFQIIEKGEYSTITYIDTLLYYFERYSISGKLWQAYMYEKDHTLIESVQYSFNCDGTYKTAAYSKRDLEHSFREIYHYLYHDMVHIDRMRSTIKIGSFDVYYTDFGCQDRLVEYDENDSVVSDIHFEYDAYYYLQSEEYTLKKYRLKYHYIAYDAYENWTQRITEYYLNDELVTALFEKRTFIYYTPKEIVNISQGVY